MFFFLSSIDRATATSTSTIVFFSLSITNLRSRITSKSTNEKKNEQAFANERLSPEVLPYEQDLVSRVRDALARHEASAAELEASHGDAAKPATVASAAATSRAKYLLAAYHRARLHKVEACAAALLDTPGAMDGAGAGAGAAAGGGRRQSSGNATSTNPLLSAAEAAHARDYFLAAGRHLKQAAARRLPPQFDSLVRQSAASSSSRDMVSGPDLSGHVVVRALADRGTVEVDPDGASTVELREGDTYAMRYSAARELLADEWVALV